MVLRAYYLAGASLITMVVMKSFEADVGSTVVRVAAILVILAWLPFAANIGGIAAALVASVTSSRVASGSNPAASVMGELLRWPLSNTRRTQVVALGVISAAVVMGLINR